MNIEIQIEGVTPLIQHAFTDADQMAATDGARSSASGSDRGTPREQAERHLYLGTDGRIIIPQPNLFSCIIEGGKFFKAGKTKITTLRSSLVPACVRIVEIEIPMEYREPWCVDTRPVRIPSTGGRILRHRPMFHEWKLSFNVELDVTEIGVKLFRDILDAAGNKIGLGDNRPACKGPYGRFKVVRWVIEQEKPKPKLRAAA